MSPRFLICGGGNIPHSLAAAITRHEDVAGTIAIRDLAHRFGVKTPTIDSLIVRLSVLNRTEAI